MTLKCIGFRGWIALTDRVVARHGGDWSTSVRSRRPTDSLALELRKFCPHCSLILAGVAPKLSPGQQSWSGSLLHQIGLENSTKVLPGSSKFSGYITISNERLLAINPDKVLVVNPSGDAAETVQSLIPFFSRLKTIDFNVMEYYVLINPGSLSSIRRSYRFVKSLVESINCLCSLCSLSLLSWNLF